jgi:hypothetical protein
MSFDKYPHNPSDIASTSFICFIFLKNLVIVVDAIGNFTTENNVANIS